MHELTLPPSVGASLPRDTLTLIAEAKAVGARLDAPTLPEAWCALDRIGPMLLERARTLPARELVEATLVLSPWIVWTPRRLPLEHHLLGALDVARSAGLDDLPLLRMLAHLAMSRGEMARARQWIQRGELAGDTSADLIRLGLHVAVRTGSYGEAEDLLSFLRDREVWTDWERTHRALLDTKHGRYEEARTLFETLRAEAKSDGRRISLGRTEFLLGELSMESGFFEEALEHIATAEAAFAPIEPAPMMLIAATRRAHAYFELGRLEESRMCGDAAWESAMSLGLAEGALEAAMARFQLACAIGEDREVWEQRVRTWLSVGTRAEVVARAELLLAGASKAPVIDEDGAWFEVAGVRTDLRRRHTVSRVLAALVAARGRPVGLDALFTAGWPKERIHTESARRRVYTAIWTLRRAGLAPFLSHVGDGYALEVALDVDGGKGPASGSVNIYSA